MIRRILVITGIAVSALFVVTGLLLAWLAGTQGGSRFLWSTVSGAVDGLTAESFEGRLAGPLSLQGLQFESEGLQVSIGSVELDWLPSYLLRREFILEKLHVADVVFTQLPSEPPEQEPDAEPFALPERIALPLAVELRDIRLSALDFISGPDAEPVRVEELALAARFRDSKLAVDSLSAHGPLFRIQGEAGAQTLGDYPLSGAFAWRINLPDLASPEGRLSFDGDLSSLRVTQEIEAPYSTSQEVLVSDLLDEPHFDARVELLDTRLEQIGETLPVMALSGRLLAEGTAADLRYRTNVDVSSEDYGELGLLARGGFSEQTVRVDELLLSLGSEASRLEIAGQAALGGATPVFDLQGDWVGLNWPLVGEPQVSSDSGRFSVSGSAEDYELELTAALEVPDQPGGEFSLSGSGDTASFELASLELKLLDGALTGQGSVQWSPEIRGSVTLEGEGLDPGIIVPDFPGDLQIALRAEGGIFDGAIAAEIETLRLSGVFRDQAVDLRAQGRLRDEEFSLDTLSLQAGETRFGAAGRVGDTLDLSWDIDSPDLADLLPGAGGSLAGSGSVGGTTALPSVRAELRGRSIAYAEYQLADLALALDLDLAREDPSSLELSLDQLMLGELEVSSIILSGRGNRGEHSLSLRAESPEGSAQLALSGDLREDDWHGELASGELQYAGLDAWSLLAPQALRISADEQDLERGCWGSGDARICLQAARDADALDAAVSVDAFGLDYLKPMIGEAFSLAGVLDARVSVRQRGDAMPEIDLALNAEGVELRTGESAERPDEVLLGLLPSRVSVTLGDEGLLADVEVPFDGGGGIRALAEVDGGSEPLMERPLDGNLTLLLEDIGFLTVLSSEIEEAAGALDGNFALSGTLAKPIPRGELKFSSGVLELAAPGLNIRDIGMRVSSSNGTHLDFSGEASSGGGTLRLDGSSELKGAETVAELELTGSRFEVVNTVDARAFITPDLKLRLGEEGINIRGQVLVPRAEITPQRLPESVVSVSSDQVIIVGEADSDAPLAAQTPLDARVRIVMGDAVSVDGFGLKGRLTGGLTVTQTPGQPTLGSGEINIVDGEYRAFGQGLVIERGAILFGGGPIAEPGLNVRAVRRPAEGILVGVSVRGDLEAPDFNVFSEPGMTQAEQLSWLVLGRPLAGASGGESDMITQAALALGLRGGNVLADRLGEGLGVDSIGIETGSGEAGAASDVNQAAFVIGKYLSPGLFVSYGIGLFDSISTVRLEYTLTESWKVSTESSTIASGGDVTYTTERR